MVPTADEGWFADMSTLVANQKWVFGAAGIVLLFGLTAGIFLCRRRRRAARYSVLPGDELALGALPRGGGRGPRTKELYDAFGEHGEDEEEDEDEPDEHTGLRAGSPGGGVGFHEGFLDDEDANTPRSAPLPSYRDEPEKRAASPHGGAASPSGSVSGSGDGSWEHASQTR